MADQRSKGQNALPKETAKLNRLVREEASYHIELRHQEQRISKAEQGVKNGEENAEWMLKQERLAYEETKKVLAEVERLVKDAMSTLEGSVLAEEGQGANEEELQNAKEAIRKAKEAIPALSQSSSE